MGFIFGIILIIAGIKIIQASKNSQEDPNWVGIFGVFLVLAGLAAMGTAFS